MIHARGEVVLDENGRPAVVHGTCQDVTESHRVEDALRAAEQLFRRAFDDAPIGMALIDLDGRWLRLNRALCQMLGRTEQQLRTTQLAELSHPDDRRLDRPLIKELLAGRRRSFAIEKRYLHADGTWSTRSCTSRSCTATASARCTSSASSSTSPSAAGPRPSAGPARSACRRSSTTRRR